MSNKPYFLLFPAFVLLTIWSCKSDRSVQQEPAVDYNRTQNEVAVVLRVEPDGLNPAITTTSYSRQVFEEIYQYLVEVDPYSLELIPILAKNTARVADITEGPYQGGATYSYEIREEAVWDDGLPITGQDFVFSVKAVLNPKVQAPRVRPFLTAIKDIQVDEANPKRLTIYTDQKDIQGEEAIAYSIPVMPRHLYDPEGFLSDIPMTDFTNPEKIDKLAASDERLQKFAEDFNSVKRSREVTGISGSGAYRLTSWTSGQEIVLERKPDWWGDRLPEGTPGFEAFPDRLQFQPVTNEETALAALKAEEVDVLSEISPESFNDLKTGEFTTERYNFATPLMLAHYFIYINTNKPLLADKRVRRALAHLVDVDDLLETFFMGFGQRLSVPVFPGADYYDKSQTPIPYDVEKAKSLLAEAGWTDTDNNGIVDKLVNGQKVEMTLEYLYTANNQRSQEIGLLIKENARKAGVNLELVGKESNLIFQDSKSGNYDLVSGGKTMSPTLWNPKQLWHTDSGAGGDNRTGFGNAETDALIDEILVTLDETKRNELYKKLERIIYDEQPMIFLFVPRGQLVVHKRFDREVSSVFPGYVASDFKLNLPNSQ